MESAAAAAAEKRTKRSNEGRKKKLRLEERKGEKVLKRGSSLPRSLQLFLVGSAAQKKETFPDI